MTVPEIVLGEATRVTVLAEMTNRTAAHVVGAAFRGLGRMITVHEELNFDEARHIAGEFGFRVRRLGDDAPGA